jgi:FkbM family methyltransferase
MEFKASNKINPDKDFFGFKMLTREKYFDEHIISDEMNNIYKIPDNPGVVVDIGAHIGMTSLLSARRGATVFAFEPEQFNYEILLYNVSINNFSDKIYCVNKGVGKPGRTKLYVHPQKSGTTSSYLEQKGLYSDLYQMVDFISIKDVFSDFNIEYCDLLKLDCEGSEEDIIRDLNGLSERIGQISVEFHNKKIMPELIKILSQWYEGENTRKTEWIFRKIR